MSNERLDDETLAALLDGTLTESERNRALAVLAASPADYDAFMLAARLQREGLEVVPSQAPPAPRRFPWRAWAIAAGILAAASATYLLVRPGQAVPSAPLVLASAAAEAVRRPGNGALDETFGLRWRESPSATRGGSGGVAAAAFRVGVLLADLEVAARVEDSAAVADRAFRIAGLLAASDAGGPAAAGYQSPERLLRDPAHRAESIERARQALGDVARVDLGFWAELVRLELLVGPSSRLLADSEARRTLDRISASLATRGGDSAAARILDDLGRLRAADPSSPEIAARIDSLLSRAARP